MVSVGLGYTTLPDPRAAASQITDQAQLGLGDKPSLAILLSTVGYDLDTLVSMVQERLGDTPLWGGTSSSGVFTSSGWITAEKGAAALMLLSGFPAGVGSATVGSNPTAAAQAAVSQAIAQAGGKAVAGFRGGRRLVVHVEDAAVAGPGVGKAVDDEHVVT